MPLRVGWREGRGEGGRGNTRLESDEAREKLRRGFIRGGRGRGRERLERDEPEEDEEFFLSLCRGYCLTIESIWRKTGGGRRKTGGGRRKTGGGRRKTEGGREEERERSEGRIMEKERATCIYRHSQIPESRMLVDSFSASVQLSCSLSPSSTEPLSVRRNKKREKIVSYSLLHVYSNYTHH